MEEHRQGKYPWGQGTESFFRNLILIATLSMLVILVSSGYGIFRVYQDHIIRDAEAEALTLGKVLIAEHRDLLIATDSDGHPRLSIAPDSLEALDRRLRRHLIPFQIVKVKIYDAGKKILFSTEPQLIGKIDKDNPRLMRALQGQPDSHLEQKDSFRDLADEQFLDVDVIESYVPIRIDDDQVAGAFEIYRDVTPYRSELLATLVTSLIILGAILLLVNGVAFLYVRRAGQRLTEVQEQLREMATIDSLTGTLNRGTILARARVEISRIARRREQNADSSLSFLLLDLDHFKNINDTYGHLIGDQVLRETCARIRAALRDYDLLGRFGGEEFLALLPDTPREGAFATAERIRKAISDTPFLFGGSTIHATASLGVSTAREEEQDLTRILNRADASLYQAKKQGRNTVASAEESQTVTPSKGQSEA